MNAKKIFLLALIINLFYFSPVTAAGQLYEDEQLVEVNKIQTLYKFIEGDKAKPLVIFIPGAAHLARIAYGFLGGEKDDFLSYWIHQKGYPFLGVSYPIDNPVYTKIYPSFNIQAWGKQIASLAKTMIKQKHLSNHVVVLAWSMGAMLKQLLARLFKKQV